MDIGQLGAAHTTKLEIHNETNIACHLKAPADKWKTTMKQNVSYKFCHFLWMTENLLSYCRAAPFCGGLVSLCRLRRRPVCSAICLPTDTRYVNKL